MTETTPFGSLSSGTSWPLKTFGWCGHNPAKFEFKAGSLTLRLCDACSSLTLTALLDDSEKKGRVFIR